MKLNNSSARKKSKLSILTFLIVVLLFICGCGGARITKANYEKIHNGMSFDEVVEILGDDYEISSDASYGGYSSSCYVWESMGYCITVIFVNGQVFSKAQAG